ncbi:OsmC family protein [Agromyces intestinalis]|uniref:OsmC family protein n=1 Tax=Agromyces intestinalis TaxID=2592652 RepID=A0A5C1YE72_9MICO|nr:OsmC family protein [Agromyces intestinalis]QEO13092.1 OsmC family protein [Agromyces intestinalis]
MSNTPDSSPTKIRQPLNGVDVPNLFATLDAVRQTPELAAFRFRARNTWRAGTHSSTEISGFHGALHEMAHKNVTFLDSDHPAVLVGADNAPTPVEYVLHALASCLTAGIGNIASARGIRLDRVSSTVEGDIDLLGLLGLSDDVRNGYRWIRVTFEISGDADDETLRGLVEQSRRRSAVYDALVNPTPVEVEVDVVTR